MATPQPAVSASDLSGPRRAAILMVLLGEDVAGKLLRHLSPDQIGKIAIEVAGLGPIASDLADGILEGYFVDAVRPPQEKGGPDVARRFLTQAAMTQEQVDRVLKKKSTEAVKEKLGPLHDAEPAVLAKTLSDEHPQTIALMLLHLPPVRSARVLGALDEEARPEIVRRMATLRQVRGELLGEVAASIQERLATTETDDTSVGVGDGLEGTAAVLQSLSRVETRKILEDLERVDPEQATLLRGRIFTFDSLVLADDRGIQELLRLVETKTLALALRGAEEDISRKVLSNLSERASGIIKDEMEFLGTVRPDDQETARREIVTVALKLEEEGRLVFTEGEPAGTSRG